MEKNTEKGKEEPKKPEVNVSALLEKIEALERGRVEDQEKLKTLYEVADKGRLLSNEMRKGVGKKPMKIKLSIFQGGVIIGWRTMKDVLIKHPTTGLTVGEEQEYEIMVMEDDGSVKKYVLDGYPAFSSARYDERVEVEVVGKKEDAEGNISFNVSLPSGQMIELKSQFVN